VATGTTYRLAWHIPILSVMIGAFIGIGIASRMAPDLRIVVAALVRMSPLLVACAVLIRFAGFVRVTSEGVCSLDTLARLRTIPWSSIRAAMPTSILGLRYLRVYSQDSRFALWVPLQLSNYDLFLQHLQAVAPEGNLLVASLMRPAA